MTFDETDVAPVGHEPTPAATAPGDTWRTSWATALSRVEVDVEAAEDLLRRLHTAETVETDVQLPTWTAPALPGPLPVEFADRARRLLERQLDVSEQLAQAMVQARSQSKALRKFNRAESRPVFVDTAL